MNILVTLNRGYLYQLCVMLSSLIKSNPDTEFDVYVMNASLTEADFEAVRQRIPVDKCRLIDIKTGENEFADAPITDRYPREMYFRIFAAKYLPESLDRILYLDPDIVVLGSVKELYETKLDGYYYAAASHVKEVMRMINKIRLGMDDEGPYINSGVMLMNLELLRSSQSEEEVYNYIRDNEKLLILPDQDVLSGLYSDKIYPLEPLRYNMTERLMMYHMMTPENVRNISAIVHYIGRNKPWKDSYIGKLGVFYEEASKDIPPIE